MDKHDRLYTTYVTLVATSPQLSYNYAEKVCSIPSSQIRHLLSPLLPLRRHFSMQLFILISNHPIYTLSAVLELRLDGAWSFGEFKGRSMVGLMFRCPDDYCQQFLCYRRYTSNLPLRRQRDSNIHNVARAGSAPGRVSISATSPIVVFGSHLTTGELPFVGAMDDGSYSAKL